MEFSGTENAGRLPDFLIIGAAKAGTSTLYRYLTRHPRIFVSAIKEPCFFDADVAWDRGLDWYRSLFVDAGPDPKRISGEASTNYTRWPQVPGVPARIRQTVPGAKFIYILRHPVDRAFSHYVHRFTKELHPGEPFNETFEDFVEHDRMCLDSSDYLLQIEQYLECFSRECFLFLLIDDLNRDPTHELRRVFRFLGVDDLASFVGAVPLVENRSSSFHDRTLRNRMMAPFRRNRFLRRLASTLPQSWRDSAYTLIKKTSYGRRIASNYLPKPMTPEMRTALLERYGASNRALSELTGLDLSQWMK